MSQTETSFRRATETEIATARAWVDHFMPTSEYDEEPRQEEYERALEILVYAGGGRDKPRRWELPAEPGPDVTVVRDDDGDLWWRTEGGWRNRPSSPDRLGRLGDSWMHVLAFAPLTDVTAEHPDYNPTEVPA